MAINHDGLTAKLNNCDICERIVNNIPPSEKCEQNSKEKHSDDDANQDQEENDLEQSVNQSDADEYDGDMFEADDDEDDEEKNEVNDNESGDEDDSFPFYLHRSLSSITSVSSNSGRQVNKTFSSDALRNIERTNIILMQKILSNNKRVNQYKIAPKCATINKVASSAINRRKDQDKIARDNQILLKKIQSVKPAVKHRK